MHEFGNQEIRETESKLEKSAENRPFRVETSTVGKLLKTTWDLKLTISEIVQNPETLKEHPVEMIGKLIEGISPLLENPETRKIVKEILNELRTSESGNENFKDIAEVKHENAEKFPCRNQELAGSVHPETGVPFVKKIVEVEGKQLEVVVPEFDSAFDAQLPDDLLKATDREQFAECNSQLKDAIEKDETLRNQFTPEQLQQIRDGETPDGYVWHHDVESGKMQLVDSEIHMKTGHTGGRSIWGGGTENR